MNLPNIKDVLAKLSVFKNNLSLLASIIIALIAVLMFIPTQLLSSGLRKDMDKKSALLGRNVQQQARSAVSGNQWELLAEHQQIQQKDAEQIALLAEQSTQRELLSYDIFFADANERSRSPLIFQRFGQKYRKSLGDMLAELRANECPTKDELDAALKAETERSRLSGRYTTMGMYSGLGSGNPYGRPGGAYGRPGGAYGQIQQTILDEICLSRAKSCALYANPGDIGGYRFWADYKYGVKPEDALKDCWYYQLGYWVIEDVFDTITAVNAGHEDVLTAPVKRLMKVSFTMGLRKVVSPAMMTGFTNTKPDNEEGDRPAYVIKVSDGLTEPCTGRLCDENIDVIHFNIVVVTTSRNVLPFMAELCGAKEHNFYGFHEEIRPPKNFRHNQIGILESNIMSIDPEGPDHQYYRYGDQPVVELDLVCEYILNKKAYDLIKPESVKKTLRGEDEVKK